MNHTPTPWETRAGTAGHVCIYVAGTQHNVAVGCKPADAEFIVRACNAHAALVIASKALLDAFGGDVPRWLQQEADALDMALDIAKG